MKFEFSKVVVRPQRLQKAQEFGCNTVVDCTTNGMGRDHELLKRLSDETGICFLASTGYFGAFNTKCPPFFVMIETADQLAEQMVKEWEKGIDVKGIKPGWIKICVGRGSLPEVHQKITVQEGLDTFI